MKGLSTTMSTFLDKIKARKYGNYRLHLKQEDVPFALELFPALPIDVIHVSRLKLVQVKTPFRRLVLHGRRDAVYYRQCCYMHLRICSPFSQTTTRLHIDAEAIVDVQAYSYFVPADEDILKRGTSRLVIHRGELFGFWKGPWVCPINSALGRAHSLLHTKARAREFKWIESCLRSITRIEDTFHCDMVGFLCSQM